MPGLQEAPGPRLQKATEHQEPAGPVANWCAQTCKLFWFLWSRPTLPVPPSKTPSLVPQSLVAFPPDCRIFQQFAIDCQNGFSILHHSRMSVHRVMPLLDIFIYQRFLLTPPTFN